MYSSECCTDDFWNRLEIGFQNFGIFLLAKSGLCSISRFLWCSRGGVNRSATVVLAYLMKYNDMTLREAWEYVRTRRPSVQPVANYMSQLREYEKSIRGSVSLEEQDVERPMSLTQRIGAWREQNRKNGSMPADLSSSRSPRDESPQDALPTRANTSPLTKRLKRPPTSSVQSKTAESECSNSDEE